jgi:Bacterial extracellular solute-binding protein
MGTDNLDTFIQKQLVSTAISRRSFLAGLATIALIGGTTTCGLQQKQPASPIPTPTGNNDIAISFVYSTEKEAWLRKAIDTFNGLHKTVEVQTGQYKKIIVNPISSPSDGWEYGSLDAAEHIIKGDIKPTAWSPANGLEISYVDTQNANLIDFAGEFSPQSLVSSPLVFAIWKERSAALQQYYGAINWDTLKDAFRSNWRTISGHADWEDVKFGHTRPDKSNSGLLTIILLAYHFLHPGYNLTKEMIDSAQFLDPLDIFEQAITDFGRSSGTYLNNIVIHKGAASYDIITTYENLVLTHDKLFDIFYPQQNMLSDHPFAIFKEATPEEHQAATIFRDFLLGPDMQKLARSLGFRPASTDISLTEQTALNPFWKTTLNIKPPQVFQSSENPPEYNVIQELICQWTKKYSKKPTALG